MNRSDNTADVLPSIATNGDRLQTLLASVIQFPQVSDRLLPLQETPDLPYWDARYFNLHQVRLWQTATRSQQYAILDFANREVLAQLFSLETIGVRYTDKMLELAETLPEQTVYTIFHAEETYHLAQFSRLSSCQQSLDPDWHFLIDLIARENKAVLCFVIQVVLEGWGLSFYCHLLKGCQNETTGNILQECLQGNSRQQAIGKTLCKQYPLTDRDRALVTDILGQLLQLIQKIPQKMIEALERGLGKLSVEEKRTAIAELELEQYQQMQLKRLHFLIGKEPSKCILTELEYRGCFAGIKGVGSRE